jgi:hypothetical protein
MLELHAYFAVSKKEPYEINTNHNRTKQLVTVRFRLWPRAADIKTRVERNSSRRQHLWRVIVKF